MSSHGYTPTQSGKTHGVNYWLYTKGAGCNIIIHYRAYSTKGTGKPLTFTSSDFAKDGRNDVQVTEIEVDKSIRVQLRAWDKIDLYT